VTARVLVAAGVALWVGASLLLSGWRRVARPSLGDRLVPFSPAARRNGVRGATPAIGPTVRSGLVVAGERAARFLGVEESCALRLRRIHSPLGVTAFRTRQFAWTGAALGLGLVTAAVGAPLPLALLTLAGAPVLAFLLIEQQLAVSSSRRQQRLRQELPVIEEQLAMLLNAGYSLGATVNRLAARGHGASAEDLRVVTNRLRQGVGEVAALREWAEVARVEPLDRLVAVIAVDAGAGDLGRLVSAEARHARRELHRRTTELVERRAQQVWIPVSVATLVPGVILLAVPFLAALRLFANA